MEQLAEFVTNHMVLSVLFMIILTLLIKNILADVGQGGTSVGTSEATRLMNRENAVLLDIRNSEEFSNGHILNATNIPFTDFESRNSDLEKLRDQPIILCCNTGSTTGGAAASLKKLGFDNIHRLKGGIDGWKHASLPLAT